MMNQIQCVPSWEVGDVPPLAAVVPPPPPPPPPPSRVVASGSHSTSLSAGQDVALLDYEVAELTWANGQLTMHGLGLPRVSSKSILASGTLESVVNQATKKPHPGGACNATPDSGLAPWFAPAPASVSMDALVPTPNTGGGGACCIGCSNTRVGSCSTGSDWSVSWSESTRRDTCQQMSGGVNGLASTSPENTKTVTVDDHDSVCHCRPQKERGKEEENEKKGTRKSSISTKRSRAAAIHSQSERKRRDKINQRMKTLQKLVPNSSETDKASTLDEVIDYLKQLQAQVQTMSRMSLPTMTMMMPMTIQQQLQLSMMSQMGMGVRMGMAGMGVDMGIGIGVGIDQMNMNVNSGIRQPLNVAGMAVPTLNPSQNVARIIVPTLSPSQNVAGIAVPTLNPSQNVARIVVPALSPSQNVAGIAVPTLNPSVFMPVAPWDGTSTIGGDRVSSSHQPSMVPIDPVLAYLACQQSQQPMTIDAYSKMVTVYQQLQRQQ